MLAARVRGLKLRLRSRLISGAAGAVRRAVEVVEGA
jgi:hypothetical protein